MNKPFWIPLIASLGTMILLFTIGVVANINILMFKMSPSYTEISFLPIVAGLLIGFTTERLLKYKSKKEKN
ncbi:ATPase [Salipaludibacillus aurantiacus]|uniref:ATPase n=1 Tax=Salipaludibacillus aurantiacus TaxID=1601833 RepID=A0A1H9Q6Y5_9BACI|nr:ATPase [Salipaludibacillus aurantiacus]SER55659.1 hypothetical protein SAMN05518684_10247 [Salipaludibacillus aurantiacus]